MESYLKLQHEPIDKTIYNIFNINPNKGFDRKQANVNMKQIIRRFHPDKLSKSQEEIGNKITKIITETWRYINNPCRELTYRVLGRTNLMGTNTLDWQAIDENMSMITEEWKMMASNETSNNTIKSQHKEETHRSTKTKERSSYDNAECPEKENQNLKKRRISEIIRIKDHDYRHKKYYATVEWSDGDSTRMELAETINHGDILKPYLMELLKRNSKRYNWLKKNQPQLFI